MAQPPKNRKNNFVARRRQSLQTFALVIALLAPFGLFIGLQQGWTTLAAACFSAIALSLVLTAWAG